MPVIRIDDDVWRELKKRAEPLVDNPNSVLRRLFGLNGKVADGQLSTSGEKRTETTEKAIEIEPKNMDASRSYHYIPVPKAKRRFFPGYKVAFDLETDSGVVRTYVTSAPKGTPYGDTDGGNYIQSKLADWFTNHREIRTGDRLRFECLEPGKRYKLSIRHT